MIRRVLLACAVLVGMMAISGMALAAPPAMTLSSWETTSADGVITGGTRTVTVTNLLDEPIEALAVPLDPTPCECSIVSASTDAGTIDGFNWNVGTLDPGETKTLTLGYELTTSASAFSLLPNPLTIVLLSASVLAIGAAATGIRKHGELAGSDISH
jgi:hypothetical protein